jgi:hypothetical protein
MTHKAMILSMALAGSAMALPQAAVACTAITLPQQPPTINYDPFSGLPQSVNFTIRLTNTCGPGVLNENRVVSVWFSDEIDGLGDKKIGGVSFDIKRNAENVLYTAADTQPPFSLVALSFDPSGASSGHKDFDYVLTMPADQAAQSASKSVRLRYRYQNEGSAPLEGSLEIPLNLQVKPSFDLRLADRDGLTGEINLGTFSGTDATAELKLRIGATVPFKISMQSTQGSVLRRTSTCGIPSEPTSDRAEQIDYSASLGAQTLSTSLPFSREQTTLEETGQRINLPLKILVPGFNPIERRAGQFCDVIKLTIEPKN